MQSFVAARRRLAQVPRAVTACLAMILLAGASTGCATYRTISAAEPGSPKVFSGTRLDINAIAGDAVGIRKSRAAPPSYPLVDLPLSVVADTVLLPLTLPVATYELVFER